MRLPLALQGLGRAVTLRFISAWLTSISAAAELRQMLIADCAALVRKRCHSPVGSDRCSASSGRLVVGPRYGAPCMSLSARASTCSMVDEGAFQQGDIGGLFLHVVAGRTSGSTRMLPSERSFAACKKPQTHKQKLTTHSTCAGRGTSWLRRDLVPSFTGTEVATFFDRCSERFPMDLVTQALVGQGGRGAAAGRRPWRAGEARPGARRAQRPQARAR